MSKENHSDYLSTSGLGDKHGIMHVAVYDYFIEICWTERRGDERKLTELGIEKGGQYRTSIDGKYSWIVWPPDILSNDDLNKIKAYESKFKLEGFISTTKLAKKYNVKPKILFAYLYKLGWIKKVYKRWEITELGKKRSN
jgi:hypothetical protein